MKDFVSKGQGDSRYLKSNLLEGTSWDAALALLRAGTFPIDLNGVNPDGYTQLGTALNKANLLTDETASALDLTGDDPTVNDALAAIAAGWTRRQLVSYTGDGTYGAANPTSLTFDFAPTIVLFLTSVGSTGYQANDFAVGVTAILTTTMTRHDFFKNGNYAAKSADGKTISWYASSTPYASNQLNTSGSDYYFLALA